MRFTKMRRRRIADERTDVGRSNRPFNQFVLAMVECSGWASYSGQNVNDHYRETTFEQGKRVAGTVAHIIIVPTL